jgi:hypothetical protein
MTTESLGKRFVYFISSVTSTMNSMRFCARPECHHASSLARRCGTHQPGADEKSADDIIEETHF